MRNTRPLSERITLSQNAINAILPQLNSATGEFNGIGYWQSGNVWSAMANHDKSAGTKTFSASVVANLRKVFTLRANYDQFGVSATLAEITKDSKYTNAAIASANWIKAHNLNNNIVLDSVNGHDCSRSPSTWLFTYNSGKFVEGLSILADVTGDSQWKTLMVNIVATSVKSSNWEGSDGIITEGASTATNNDGVGFKGSYPILS
ncbi:hypothetical protein DXG01_016159 [Tephrocybe rancida]|nr:hypothetical protein DXG01_016159 [Tephrocybe rancida]